MAGAPTIQSRQYQEFRARMKAEWQPVNAPCSICRQRTIDWDGDANEPQSFELHHTPISRKKAIAMGKPGLITDPANAAPSHSRCNRGLGAGEATYGLGETTEAW